MTLSIIVAMSANRVIGRNNALPWRLKTDLARFQQLTMGHWLLMGRKTFESIGRPLPGRKTVVLSGRSDYAPPGVLVAHSLDEALGLAGLEDPAEEMFVAGGEQVYRQTIGRARRLYLTLVNHDFDGDAHFPEFEESRWALISREDHPADADNPYAFSFLTYDRKKC
jgi:dihydrofolate reductase